jgi:hypothetical protein
VALKERNAIIRDKPGVVNIWPASCFMVKPIEIGVKNEVRISENA